MISAPPHSPDAEAATLGSILLDHTRVMEACIEAGLTEEAFYIPAHRLIYAAMLHLHGKDSVVTLSTVPDALRATGQLEAAGGHMALNALVDATDTPAHAEQHIAVVKAKHAMRSLINVCSEISVQAQRTDDAPALLAEAEGSVAEIGEMGHTRAKVDVSATWDDIERRMASGGEDSEIGIPTGIDYWDEQGLMRFRPGGMYLLMGRQKCFKSTLAFHIITEQLHAGRKVGLATLEMPHDQALAKMGGALMGCSVDNVLAGREAPSEGAIAYARGVLKSGRLQVDDSVRTVDEFAVWYKRGVRRHGWDLVVLDYLQRLQCKGESKWDSIEQTSQRITALAKDVGVPILCMAKLTVQDGRTKMYGSSAGGYDCYASCSIWRDSEADPNIEGQTRYTDSGFPDYNARAWLKIDEQRFGVSGKTIPISVCGRTGAVTVPRDGEGIVSMMGEVQEEAQ